MKAFHPLLCALLLLPNNSFGWGPTGHRVIGEIAQNHLTKKAEHAVDRILQGGSMVFAATWMDEIRSDPAYDHTHDWHWVTIPDSLTYSTAQKNPHGDVVEAIGRMIAVVKSDTATPEQKRIGLCFLIHLVGDLHQPLHVGRGDDKGGNTFQVRWFKKGSNLHRIWDSGMIDGSLLSYTELADGLDHASRQEMKEWMLGDAATWAQENVAFRNSIYDVQRGDDLGYAYQYKHWPLVQEQLLKAGIRLAGVLNAIFG